MFESPEIPEDGAVRRSGGVRSILEALVCLAIAVVLFRCYQVEGYLISTGSMAPTLRGYHKQVVCPTCAHEFAFGVAYDDDYGSLAAEEEAENGERVTCPHCGQLGIDLSSVPRTQGDQLLVHKLAYLFRGPRRWEVIVFRNPHNPSQAYVKRVVALPGEAVQIIDGNLYINETIVRKTLEEQHNLRQLVFDQKLEPGKDKRWQPRWRPDPKSPWEKQAAGFEYIPNPKTPVDDWQWLTYSHWVRKPGPTPTVIPFAPAPPPEWLADLHPTAGPEVPAITGIDACPVSYDPKRKALVCRSVLPKDWVKTLLERKTSPAFQNAIRKMAISSQLTPITDLYGYNRWRNGNPQVVRDVMLEAKLQYVEGRGSIAAEITDGEQRFRVVFNFETERVSLWEEGKTSPLEVKSIPPQMMQRAVTFEMSVFDRQLLVAVDGKSLFAPIRLSTETPKLDLHALKRPVRLGVRDAWVAIDELRVWRDVHYTRGRAVNGVDHPFRLAGGEYFVLGDNSPLSSDSRNWSNGAVPEKMILGKPFIVHLPSRPGRIGIGSWSTHIRLPDFSRIRYVR